MPGLERATAAWCVLLGLLLPPTMATANERSAKEPAATRNAEAELAPRAAAQRATALLRRAERSSRRLLFQLDLARSSSDARAARCVDDILAQTHAVVRRVESRGQRLLEAHRSGDDSAVRYHASVLPVLEERLEELDRRSRSCHGTPPGPPGTVVTVTIDADVPREDPTVVRESDPRRLPAVPPP